MTLSLTFYGGVKEIGGNKFLVEDSGTCFFLDFGLPFGKRYNYFEEYLNPRPGVGLLDPLEMGLLPPLLGIYRPDLIPDEAIWQRFEPSLHRELKVDGILLSHAHLDHSGYISFLREDIPIYATQMTAFIAKALQDSAPTNIEKEVCYSNPRIIKEGYLSTGKLYKQRPFIFLDNISLSGKAKEFWNFSPAKTKPLESQNCAVPSNRVGNLPLRHFPVDHSIFGATAFAVETSIGWIGYTGDLRLHGRAGKDTENFIEEMNKLQPQILLCEGTRATAQDKTQAKITEEEVYENALKAVKNAEGLVIADFGPRNVERLLIFLRIAQETQRMLVILAKDAYLLKAMHLASKEVPNIEESSNILIYKELKSRLNLCEEAIHEQHQSNLVNASQIHKKPEDYILCFSFWDMNKLIDIAPNGGIYIYSSSEAYNEEQRVDLWRLRNWIEHFGMELVGDPEKGGENLHASGHASGPELLEIVRRIKPKIVIPIHTENPNYFVQNLNDPEIEILVPKEGQTMIFPQKTLQLSLLS